MENGIVDIIHKHILIILREHVNHAMTTKKCYKKKKNVYILLQMQKG